MSHYIKSIALVMALLATGAAAVSYRLEAYPFFPALAAIAFMGMNALFAVYPLYLNKGRMNPFNIYLGGMVIRLGIIGIALIALLALTQLSQADLLSLTFTAMASFVAYLAVEIRHFIRNPSGPLTAGPSPR